MTAAICWRVPPISNGAAGGGGDSPDDMRLNSNRRRRARSKICCRKRSATAKRARKCRPISISTASPPIPKFTIPTARWCVRRKARPSNPPNAEGGGRGRPVSVANGLPANPAQVANQLNGGGGSSNKNNHTEETVNYEINKTIRNQVRESGQVKRLSVAVVVDGTYKTGCRRQEPAPMCRAATRK